MTARGDCRWCAHTWDRHGLIGGCTELVGAGTEVAECPCTLATNREGELLDEIERLKRKVSREGMR